MKTFSLQVLNSKLLGAIEKNGPKVNTSVIDHALYDQYYDMIDLTNNRIQDLDTINDKLQEIINVHNRIKSILSENVTKLGKILNKMKLSSANVRKFGTHEELKPQMIKKYKQNPIEMDTMMRDILKTPPKRLAWLRMMLQLVVGVVNDVSAEITLAEGKPQKVNRRR